jgi:hypothetical protein
LVVGGIALPFLGAGQAPSRSDRKPLPAPTNSIAGAKVSPLPITQVIIFNSGVAYFQRQGEVDGNARVELSFPVHDVNDLLKSLVIQDPGGQVVTVSYDSQDPVDKTLKSFALDLTRQPTFADLLRQARGEKVEVLWQPPANPAQTLKGAIVGVEKQRQPVKDNFIEVELLNLSSAEGLRSLPLSQVQRVRFVNPLTENDLKRALEVLAASHDTQKRTAALLFTGKSKRQVKVGYVLENPVWKTSYRLVVNSGNKLFLQGWGIVENQTDEDWNNVRVTLVSGRPISFQMDLYQPLYVHRPTVQPELFASLQPPTYSGGMGGYVAPTAAAPPVPQEASRDKRFARQALGGEGKDDKAALDLQQGVASLAVAMKLGDFFQYAIKDPVTLPRQKSAMLPIVNQPIEGKKVSIYNPQVHAKYPLLGLKLKNTTGLHLTQGPITVFDSSRYAGDARILDLEPNEDRLISYAVDLGTEVEPVAASTPDRLIAVKVVKGILYATSKWRESKIYQVKNRSDQDRVLWIEHPFRADWKLVSPDKPVERSRDMYRFQVAVPAGKTARLEVAEEQDRVSLVVLSNTDDQTIRLYLTSKVSSPRVREALGQAIALKIKLADTLRGIAKAEADLKAITDDQARIRANLERVPKTSAAYQRYLKKFDEQEPQIEKLQEQIRKARQKEEEQRKAYDTFLVSLNVE